MTRGVLQKTLVRLGDVVGIGVSGVRRDPRGFSQYKYMKSDGSFDYDKYRRLQIRGNKDKIDAVWARQGNIAFLADFIQKTIGQPEFGLCHGTRRGKEQAWFREYLDCEVIGTEISDTAGQFPHTIQWDFHEVKPEWLDAVDFIYSNSLDHAYDPEKCLNAWMRCLLSTGVCIIEHSSSDASGQVNKLDAFGADMTLMTGLINQWGRNRYGVTEILEAPEKHHSLDYLNFIILRRV